YLSLPRSMPTTKMTTPSVTLLDSDRPEVAVLTQISAGPVLSRRSWSPRDPASEEWWRHNLISLCLEAHGMILGSWWGGLNEAARVHHAARQRGGRVAARGARAAGP